MQTSCRKALAALGVLMAAASALGQTATYHLHNEASNINRNFKRLLTAGPDAAATTALTSALKGKAAGEYVISEFETQTNVPTNTNVTAVVPNAATSGNVVVTSGGLQSNGAAFTVLVPTISNTAPTAGRQAQSLRSPEAILAQARGPSPLVGNPPRLTAGRMAVFRRLYLLVLQRETSLWAMVVCKAMECYSRLLNRLWRSCQL